MRRRAALSLALLALLSGCGRPEPARSGETRSERNARYSKMATDCGLPARTATLDRNGELHVRPPRNARYESVDCLLTALKKSGAPLKMGFVGSEAFETGNAQR